MKYYLLNFSIIISGCSQNIGSLSIASTQPVEIDKKYESIGLIEGESELVTSSSRKMVNIDKAIDYLASTLKNKLTHETTTKLREILPLLDESSLKKAEEIFKKNK